MRDEVLDKALQEDPKVIPRYNVVRPDGTLVAENVELVLVNRILTPGMPFDNFHVLSDETSTMLGMDPGPATPDDAFQMLAALASSGGGSGDTGELEDFEFEVGSVVNKAAGWNQATFDRPFERTPRVFIAPQAADVFVFVQNITKTGFQYCLKTLSVSTKTVYTGAGTGTQPAHSATTVVGGTSLATTASQISVSYLAVDFGGDRKC